MCLGLALWTSSSVPNWITQALTNQAGDTGNLSTQITVLGVVAGLFSFLGLPAIFPQELGTYAYTGAYLSFAVVASFVEEK